MNLIFTKEFLVTTENVRYFRPGAANNDLQILRNACIKTVLKQILLSSGLLRGLRWFITTFRDYLLVSTLRVKLSKTFDGRIQFKFGRSLRSSTVLTSLFVILNTRIILFVELDLFPFFSVLIEQPKTSFTERLKCLLNILPNF